MAPRTNAYGMKQLVVLRRHKSKNVFQAISYFASAYHA